MFLFVSEIYLILIQELFFMPTYIILPLTHYKTMVYFNSYFAHLYDTIINTLQNYGLF